MLLNQRQSLVTILRVCTKNGLSDQGRQVHCFLLKLGSCLDLFTSNYLIDMYSKCREPIIAHKVFDKMPERSVVSWTALMSGHVLNGELNGSLSLFSEMVRHGVSPNEFTLSTNLKACGLLNALEKGLQIHGFCLKMGFETMVEVGNSLVDMYSKCGGINEAERVFGSMVDTSLITWNAMIAGYVHSGYGGRALDTFRMMRERPDKFTLTSLLKACSSIGMIHGGKQIHGFLIRSGFPCSSSATITGSIVDLYVKCGDLFGARKAFDQIKEKTMISWSSLILGYAQEGDFVEAMSLFRQLRELTSRVDSFVLSGIIGVFADFALLRQGQQMQALAVKLPSGLETSVSNSVVDMYLKCGLVDEAEKFFDEMQSRDVISWTVMITGYGKHGLGKKAVSVFKQMLRYNIEPDDVCYLAVLSACSHSGLIKEGEELFSNLLETPGIKPRVEHYACVVDLLGRAGRLKEGKHLIDSMPVKPNIGIWQTLLSGCRLHGDIELGKEVSEILLRIDGNNPANYVMVSNLYGQAGYWQEHGKAREVGKTRGLKKEAGMSWVEIEREVYFFRSGEDSHPLTPRIQEALREVERRMREELGYVYGLKQEMHDIDDESKEENLRAHSEKLAIGLALASGGLNQEAKTIRVFKNLRVCVDCHEFIKGLSKIMKIKFVVRDAVRIELGFMLMSETLELLRREKNAYKHTSEGHLRVAPWKTEIHRVCLAVKVSAREVLFCGGDSTSPVGAASTVGAASLNGVVRALLLFVEVKGCFRLVGDGSRVWCAVGDDTASGSPVDSGNFFIVVRALECAFIWLTVDSGDPFASHNHVSLVLEGDKRGPYLGLGRGGVALVSCYHLSAEVSPVWCTSLLAAVASSLLGWEAVSNAVYKLSLGGVCKASCYSEDDSGTPGIRGNKENLRFSGSSSLVENVTNSKEFRKTN
ncbi:hypothetical protein YC2023_038818 [Brassica napus]